MKILMIMNSHFIYTLYCFLILFNLSVLSQEVSITEQLKKIERGEIQSAKEESLQFLKKYPEDPSVIFLDAVLTENSMHAISKFEKIIKNYPNSKYADASLFRLYSYYYAIGSYKTAESYLKLLQQNHPSSPYITYADKTIPTSEDYSPPIKEEPKKEEKKNEKSDGGKYSIQVGAFLNRQNAEKLSNDLYNSGYSTEIIEKNVGGSIFHVVLVGKYDNENTANSMLQQININFKLDGKVVKQQ